MSAQDIDQPFAELPRAYLYSQYGRGNHPSWMEAVDLPVGRLSVSSGYSPAVAKTGKAFVAILGHCFDLQAPGLTEIELAERMLRDAMLNGSAYVPATTDYLLGRFAVIVNDGTHAIVFHDATGMRTVYYAEAEPIIASHSTLIGGLIDQVARPEIFSCYRYGLPGTQSPVPGVRVLPANFLLSLSNQGVERFWPRRDRVERSVDDVLPEIEDLLIRSAEAIASRWIPAVSMTAGIDSRVSLSAYRHTGRAIAFTYDRGKDDANEVRVAALLAKRAGVAHRSIYPIPRTDAVSSYELLEGMVDHRHGNDLSVMYREAFRDGGYVHARSNLLEIGRAFWRQHPVMPRVMKAENWSLIGLSKHAERSSSKPAAVSLMKEEMQAFIATAGYDLSDPRHPTLAGYDAWDLIYWEHRMATWHGQVLLGSDMAFETSIIFNSRALLSRLLSVPLADRIGATLMRRFIARRSPDFGDVGINSHEKRRTPLSIIRGIRRRIARQLRSATNAPPIRQPELARDRGTAPERSKGRHRQSHPLPHTVSRTKSDASSPSHIQTGADADTLAD